VELLGEARFRIFDALVETEEFSFLAIGRPEGAGCYCAVNAYLKEVIDMVSKDFDYVVIDGEAGIEQINRRVMEKVSHLFLVSDASFKGVQVLRSIQKVAGELVMYEKCGAVINRVDNPEILEQMSDIGAPIVSVIPSDGDLALNDIKGQSIFALKADASVLEGAKRALEQMGI